MGGITGLLTDLHFLPQRFKVGKVNAQQPVFQEAILSFDAAITPGFARRIKERLHSKIDGGANDSTEGTRIAI